MAVEVQRVATLGAGAAIQAGVLQHRVQVRALWPDQRPVGAHAVAIEFKVAHAAVVNGQGKPFDVGVQAAMAYVDTNMLAVTVLANLGIQVLAHLETVQVAIQARADRAAPLLAQRAAVGLPPAGGQGAFTLQ
ncbi:hypothetical protein D9M71_763660 [compost metagenome]